MILLGYACALTSCHREDNPAAPLQTDIPILMSASSEWPELTKVNPGQLIGDPAIDDKEELIGDGIRLWAFLNSKSIFSDVEGSEKGIVALADDDYAYEPERYWQVGHYSFAAILPSSFFDGESCTCSIGEHDYSYVDDAASWTMNFGSEGFNLAESQYDVMTAFEDRDFTEEDVNLINQDPDSEVVLERTTVNLDFSHQLALLNFNIKNEIGENSIVNIKNVKVFGNHTTAYSLTNEGVWNYGSDINEVVSDEEKPFFSADFENEDSGISVENLLVFPETEGSIKVSVTYIESLADITDEDGNLIKTPPITKTTGEIPCDWSASKIYTYDLKISESEIIFFAPIVAEWDKKSLGDIKM